MAHYLFFDTLNDAVPGIYQMRTMARSDGNGIVAFPYGPDWGNAMTSSIGNAEIELSQEDIVALRLGRNVYR